ELVQLELQSVGSGDLLGNLSDELLRNLLGNAQHQDGSLICFLRRQSSSLDVDAGLTQGGSNATQSARNVLVQQEEVTALSAHVDAAAIDTDNLLDAVQASESTNDGSGGAISTDDLDLENGAVGDGLRLGLDSEGH